MARTKTRDLLSISRGEYPDNTMNIESPEREKFVNLRQKLGYIKS